eukprot:250757-Chlamydomonas_euryale.AAC.9
MAPEYCLLRVHDRVNMSTVGRPELAVPIVKRSRTLGPRFASLLHHVPHPTPHLISTHPTNPFAPAAPRRRLPTGPHQATAQSPGEPADSKAGASLADRRTRQMSTPRARGG